MTEPANEIRPAAAAMPLGLFVYTLIYGGMTVLAGVLAYKQVQLWPTELAVESGIFAFLLLVVISSTIAQLYGEKLANRIVWWGFIPLLIASLLMQLVLNLPASVEMVEFRGEDLAAFERVHATLWRVWMAGPAAYIVSLLLNVWIFSRLRGSSQSTSTVSLMMRGAIAFDYRRRGLRTLAGPALEAPDIPDQGFVQSVTVQYGNVARCFQNHGPYARKVERVRLAQFCDQIAFRHPGFA